MALRQTRRPDWRFNLMGVSDELGSITPGKLANLIVTNPLPSLAFIPYCHQTPFICKVLLRGQEVHSRT